MRAPEWTDEEALQALHLRDVDRLTAVQIAARFGRSRSAVCGLFKRIADDLAKSGPDAAGKPENLDGGMPPGWWKHRAK